MVIKLYLYFTRQVDGSVTAELRKAPKFKPKLPEGAKIGELSDSFLQRFATNDEAGATVYRGCDGLSQEEVERAIKLYNEECPLGSWVSVGNAPTLVGNPLTFNMEVAKWEVKMRTSPGFKAVHKESESISAYHMQNVI